MPVVLVYVLFSGPPASGWSGFNQQRNSAPLAPAMYFFFASMSLQASQPRHDQRKVRRHVAAFVDKLGVEVKPLPGDVVLI